MKFCTLTKVIKRLYPVILLLILAGCNKSSNYDETISNSTVENISRNNLESKSDNKENLKIIKSANVKYKVNNVKLATRKIKNLAKKNKGYISDLKFKNTLKSIENRFTIRIPKEYFDVFLDSIHNYVEFIDFEKISTKDVTEEFFDTESRLKTKIEVKKRFEEILRKKAKTVDEILNTEEKIRIIQEEIEATTGKLTYLKNKVSYSTIHIELYEVVEYKSKPKVYKKSFLVKTKEGFINGSTMVSKLIIGLLNIWPIVLLGVGIFLIYRKKNR